MNKSIFKRSTTKKLVSTKTKTRKDFSASDRSETNFKVSQSTKNSSNATKLLKHLKIMKQTQKFQEETEIEFEQLAKSIINLKEKSLMGFRGACILEPGDVITALIDLTDMDGLQLSLDQIPTALKVLRKIIESENPLTMKPAAEWSGEEDNPTIKITQNQNLLSS